MELVKNIAKVPKDWDGDMATMKTVGDIFDISFATETGLFQLYLKAKETECHCKKCGKIADTEILPQENAEAKLVNQFRRKFKKELLKLLDINKKKVKKLSDLKRLERKRIFENSKNSKKLSASRFSPAASIFQDHAAFLATIGRASPTLRLPPRSKRLPPTKKQNSKYYRRALHTLNTTSTENVQNASMSAFVKT